MVGGGTLLEHFRLYPTGQDASVHVPPSALNVCSLWWNILYVQNEDTSSRSQLG